VRSQRFSSGLLLELLVIGSLLVGMSSPTTAQRFQLAPTSYGQETRTCWKGVSSCPCSVASPTRFHKPMPR